MNYLEQLWKPEVVFRQRGFLTGDECAKIRADMLQSPVYTGTIVKRDGVPSVDTKVRRATNVRVSGGIREFMDARLGCVRDQLSSYFETQTSGHQPPQFLLYREGEFFRRHRDVAREYPSLDIAERKLSIVLFLNDCRSGSECSFEGGILAFIGRFSGPVESNRLEVIPEEGMLVAFPADLLHEVTRVRSGARFTVVSWLV
jgi:predicted 2-oxoglutarate/Fe(II)-dependent dioxygenase YbiX